MRWRRRKEPNDWLEPFTPKIMPFRQRKFGRGSSDLGQQSAWRDVLNCCQNSWYLAREKNWVFRTEVGAKGRADLMPKSPGSLTHKKNLQFLGWRLAWKDVLTWCQKLRARSPAKRIFYFRTAVDVKIRADLFAKTPGKKWNRIFGQKITVPSARF